jgi:hypothetical protein
MGEPVQNSGASTLTELELQILEFERQWWRYPGSKEAAIRELFSISTPRYYQLLNALLDNSAAESAVPMAKDMLVGAVKSMSVQDAKTILQGGSTAATNYFSSKTREPLGQKFLPVITQATAKVGLVDKYNAVAGKASKLGLVKPQDASLEHYVNGKALDGLFLMIGEEEKKIRQDPIGTGSAILSRVFGALK